MTDQETRREQQVKRTRPRSDIVADRVLRILAVLSVVVFICCLAQVIRINKMIEKKEMDISKKRRDFDEFRTDLPEFLEFTRRLEGDIVAYNRQFRARWPTLAQDESLEKLWEEVKWRDYGQYPGRIEDNEELSRLRESIWPFAGGVLMAFACAIVFGGFVCVRLLQSRRRVRVMRNEVAL
jgi:hypothetical protein